MGSFELNEAASQVARGLKRAALAPVTIALVLAQVDAACLALAFWFGSYAATPAATFAPLLVAAQALGGAAAAALLCGAGGCYEIGALRRPLRGIPRGLVAAAPVAAVLSLVAPSAAPDPTPLLGLLLLAAALVLVPLRLLQARLVGWAVAAGLTERRAVLAGGGEHAARLIRGLAQREDCDVRVVGIFDDRDDVRSPIQVLGVPKIGGYADLMTFVRSAEIDMVIVTLPLEAEQRINWLLGHLKVLPVDVRLSAFTSDFAFRGRGEGGLIAAVARSFAPERQIAKRSLDLAVASLALVLLGPLMLAAALAVKLDSRGPVFFRQRRHGFNDRVIEVLKFRSMYVEEADPDAKRVVTKGDPRVTRVGRVLRKTSIDELPQLWNVLKGDLSLVGPRPHAVEAFSSGQVRFSAMVDGYSARHRLPPGITGWAQINGWRGEIDDPEKLRARFEHDLWYIENWSLWLDIRILLRTPLSLLNTKSAY